MCSNKPLKLSHIRKRGLFNPPFLPPTLDIIIRFAAMNQERACETFTAAWEDEREKKGGECLCLLPRQRGRSAHLWRRAVSHTLFHTEECTQITANPKCHSQIPESSLLAYPLHFSSTSPPPLFNAAFEFLLGAIEPYNLN